MDNLGVRLPVDATTKSKFKSERPHESYERRNDRESRKVHREIIGYWSQITIRA
jgi:hypothetical protein